MPDMTAAKRAHVADELARLVSGGIPASSDLSVLSRSAASFELALYDAGIDLDDLDDAATVCAVLSSLVRIANDQPGQALAISCRVATTAFARGIERAQRPTP